MVSNLLIHWLNCQLDGPALEGIGRRHAKLLATNQFWLLSKEQKTELVAGCEGVEANPFTQELLNRADPFDKEDPQPNFVRRRGLILRTDFSNDHAWTDFCDIVRRSEREGLRDLPSSPGGENAEGDDDESSSDDSEDDLSDALAFVFVVPPPEHRDAFMNQSNLSLLRIFLDVDIAPSNIAPEKAKQIVNNLPICDCDGFQEVYSGRILWVYDAMSNQDGSVRLVTSHGRMQKKIATGDSWRVKARSIWELQLNLDAGTIAELEFNHDPNERAQNLAEWGINPHDTQPVIQYNGALQMPEMQM